MLRLMGKYAVNVKQNVNQQLPYFTINNIKSPSIIEVLVEYELDTKMKNDEGRAQLSQVFFERLH